jgi:hypothetical protein
LADLGARVIKIERPEVGDFARAYDQRARGQASHFVWVNRSKESLALDLKNEKHLEVLKALIAKADVLVQNLAPGATTRMGLDAATLRSQNPSLIVCDISGYGLDGPYRDKKAYDLLIQSEAGYLSVTGTPDSPSKSGNSIADSYIETEAANLMRFRACELFDANQPCGAEANMAKYLAAKASWEAANVCLQTHGGFGFAAEYDVERKFRETRLYQVAPISTNLIYSYMAEHVLGLPRSF